MSYYRFAVALFWSVTFLATAVFGPSSFAQESHSPGWVVISVDDYRDLRAKAYPAENRPEPAAIDATVTRVDYDLQVNGESAIGQASVTVDVLKEGWVRVPIPSGLLVRDAQMNGKLVSLSVASSDKGTGHLTALLSHAGRSVLVLGVVAPVTDAATSETLVLPATDSGITRATVQLLQPEVDVTLTGGLITDKEEGNRQSKWTAYGHGTEPLTFTWRRRATEHRTTLPLRQRGSLIEMVSLGEDSTNITAEVNLEITQGATQEAKLQLGDDISINQVSGATVADWELAKGELKVKFLEAAEHEVRFVISCETRLPRDGQIAVPVFKLKDTDRDSGGVAVEVLGAGEIKDAKSQGLEEADATDLGDLVTSRQSPSLVAYRFRGIDAAPRSLSLNVARYTQQAVLMANIEEARYRVLYSNDGKTLVQARYAVRNNQRNFLKLTLPTGAMLWSAALSGSPVRPGQAPDGGLLLPLQKARGSEDAPEFAVEVVYFSRGTKWVDKGRVSVNLPSLDLPISRTGLLVYYPPLFKISSEPGAFREVNYTAPVSSALNAAGGLIGGLAESAGRDRGELTRNQKFFDKNQGVRAKGILPLRVSFPEFGPSVFLAAELTSAGQSPTASLNYQLDKKGGR